MTKIQNPKLYDLEERSSNPPTPLIRGADTGKISSRE